MALTDQLPNQLRDKAYAYAQGMLTPQERGEAAEAGMERWAEEQKALDKAMLREGFGLFGKAPRANQRAALAQVTLTLTDHALLMRTDYWDQYAAGTLPIDLVSPWWIEIRDLGGEVVFREFQRRYRALYRDWRKGMGIESMPGDDDFEPGDVDGL